MKKNFLVISRTCNLKFKIFSELGDGGDVTVADFYKTAKEICATPNTDQPFMCLDVSYMAVLLEEGYGLKPQTKIKVNTMSIKKVLSVVV